MVWVQTLWFIGISWYSIRNDNDIYRIETIIHVIRRNFLQNLVAKLECPKAQIYSCKGASILHCDRHNLFPDLNYPYELSSPLSLLKAMFLLTLVGVFFQRKRLIQWLERNIVCPYFKKSYFTLMHSLKLKWLRTKRFQGIEIKALPYRVHCLVCVCCATE